MAIIFFTILIVGVIAAVLVMASKRNSPKQLNEQSKDDKLKNSSPVEDIIERITQEDSEKKTMKVIHPDNGSQKNQKLRNLYTS